MLTKEICVQTSTSEVWREAFFLLLYNSSHTNALLIMILIKALGPKKKKKISINLFWNLYLLGHMHQSWFSCMTAAWSICLFNLNSHYGVIAKKELVRKSIPSLRKSNTVCFNKYGETTEKKKKRSPFCKIPMS